MNSVENSLLVLLAVIIPLLAVIPIILADKKPNVREAFSIIASFLTFLLVVYIYNRISLGYILEFKLFDILPGVSFKLQVDKFGLFFALMASFLWFITIFYSIGYMRGNNEKKQTRFFVFFSISMFGAMGAAFSGNLFTLYIFYELITFSTYPLVAHKETDEALQGARRYLTYLLLTSVIFFLPALIYVYNVAGTLEFTLGGVFNNDIPNKKILGVMLLFFVFGSAKAAVMPFHLWLPSAMVAPTPVSALLHAVAVVKTGVFVIIRVFVYIFGVDFIKAIANFNNMVTISAVFTIIVASMVALRQDNIKSRLAYSTISQLSYIVMAVSLLSPYAITGSIMHMVAHGFGKITLFFWAGAVYVANHKTKVSELNGIGKEMPFSTFAFTIGALSMIGFPPFGGFVSKWFIANGAVEADKIWILIVLVMSALLNAGYFVPIFIKAYFGKKDQDDDHHGHEANYFMVIPLLITSILTILLFFYPNIFLRLATSISGIGG